MFLTENTFLHQLELIHPEYKKYNYLLAVSGGADSMVLAYLFKKSGLNFQIAHINYKLRDEESEKDQKLVTEFCKKNKIPLHVYEVSEKDNKPEGSIQLWARDLRYDFFRKIQKEHNLDFLVTAHHLNDQLETFFINLSRGSGLKGLCAIPENENGILRPFLHVSKEEIYQFAKENNIEFREDKSNQKNDYLRNKIRNEIVPQLLQTNDHFLENFDKSLNIIKQSKSFIDEQIETIFEEIQIKETDDELVLDKLKLSEKSAFVKFEILKQFGFNKENEIEKIFSAESGKIFKNNDFQLIINRNELIISAEKHSLEEKEIIVSEKEKSEINLSEYSGFLSKEWLFDNEKLNYPIKLRKIKNGDTFMPTKMKGSKKVSKFLKDKKLSILAKQKIWLLCDGNNTVLGVIPYRQDRRFAATDDTKNILKINL